MEANAEHVLSFKELCYSVTIKHGKLKGTERQILHSISADCMRSGALTALMGPSGSGKTSTLDILADVSVPGRVSGEVLLDGMPRRDTAFKHLASYVMQKDVLVPSATVSEALVTSALLKLPRTMSKQHKLQRVETLMQQLELSHVADSLIGDETLGIKGISGGEKRRVSVGVELVKDPAIILLDEPTTGLDSEMALGVMAALKGLAKAGKMVVATIHQPNSSITDTFDNWLLLAKGRLLYAGPWADAVGYFQSVGRPCPLYKNPTDVFMALASDEVALRSLADAFLRHPAKSAQPALQQSPPTSSKDVELGCLDDQQQTTCQEISSNSSSSNRGNQDKLPDAPSGLLPPTPHHQLDAAASRSNSFMAPLSLSLSRSKVTRLRRIGSSSSSSRWDGFGGASPVWYQVLVLMVRFLRSWWRTPVMVAAEAAQYIVLSVFMGLLYLRQPPLLPDAPLDRMSAVFLTLSLLAFTPSYTALIVWDHERLLLRRESSTRMYSRGAFFLAKSLVTAPVEAVQVTGFAVICYFMFGFQPVAAKFVIWWITLILFTLCSETIGFLCAIITPDSKIGVSVLSVIMIIILSFSGYLVRNVPVYFSWVGKVSYFSYASDILVTNEFSGLAFLDPASGASVPGESLMPAAMKPGLGLGGNLGVLLGITLGTRLLCWGLLEAAVRWRGG